MKNKAEREIPVPEPGQRMNRLMVARAEAREQADARVKELIAMEYTYLTQSFIANEEMGEKRVSLFLTLTAGLGAAALIAADKLAASSPPLQLLVPAIGVIWLLCGYLTFVRILSRNKVTDEIKDALGRVRAWYVRPEDSKTLGVLPYPPYGPQRSPRKFRFRASAGGRGGYAELVALINSVVAAALAYYVAGPAIEGVVERGNYTGPVRLAVSFAILVATWWIHARLAAKAYASR